MLNFEVEITCHNSNDLYVWCYFQVKESETGSRCYAMVAWPCNWLSCIYSIAGVVSDQSILHTFIAQVGWVLLLCQRLHAATEIHGLVKLAPLLVHPVQS